jgi:capsular exopolysaccharide synthesis family protein
VQQDSEPLNLEHALRIIRRRAPLVAACCLVVAAAAFAFSRHETKKYTATASIVFQNNPLSQQIVGLPSNSSNLLVQQAGNVELVQLGDMAAKTARLLGHGLTQERVKKSLTVSGLGESNAVDVSATADSPLLAAAIANTYATQFVAEQQASNRQFFRSALALVDRQLAALPAKQRYGPAAVPLQNRAQTLRFLSELKYGNVQVAQEAQPPASPSSPKTTTNTVLGVLLGLLLGLGIAFLLEHLDRNRRITEPKDLQEIYRAPLLGSIPLTKCLSGRGGPLAPAEVETFNLLRAHLRTLNPGCDPRMVLLASPEAGEGRSTVARNLAEAAARLGSRVLLIEADLRHPTLACQLGIDGGPSLPGVLAGACSMEEATRTVSLDSPAGEDLEERTLDLLLSSVPGPPNPGALIESPTMNAVLAQARSTYDFTVIDTPPLSSVSDAFPLLAKVDGVLIIGRVGRSRRDLAEDLHELLARGAASLLGVIANASGRGAPATRRRPGGDTAAQSLSPAALSSNGARSSDELASPAANR